MKIQLDDCAALRPSWRAMARWSGMVHSPFERIAVVLDKRVMRLPETRKQARVLQGQGAQIGEIHRNENFFRIVDFHGRPPLFRILDGTRTLEPQKEKSDKKGAGHGTRSSR
jgi:hypothetical protein